MYERLLNASTVAPLFATQSRPAGPTQTTVGLGGRGVAIGQTLLELAAGAELSELQHPDQATILVQVLSGRVELAADQASWLGGPGDLLIVPQPEHTLRALEISTVLLTAVPRVESAPWVETSQARLARTPPPASTQVQRWTMPRLLGSR
ncbi:quercetin dioxygenase-like cupin family protein [Nakamurella sp. UYEF19]|uniref:LuxR family transcriptional regulator n=1 Tax=Nakamurella sp. UYEF19 TaxID=1756392 RepID=UPI0033998A65